jgi:alpha-tubulin suppressor-like RCC1 family protein
MKKLFSFTLMLAFIIMSMLPCLAQGAKVIAIDAGDEYSVALMSDGTVWAWGYNWLGRLGNDSYASSSSPLPIRSSITKVKAISAGSDGVSVLRDDGTVWSWGGASYGQMGDGKKVEYGQIGAFTSTPTMANISSVKALSRGSYFTVTALDNGTVWAWGYNYDGRVGDGTNGTNTDKWCPVQIMGLSNIKDVKAGLNHWVVLDNDGNVWMAGQNITSTAEDITIPINNTSAIVVPPPPLSHPVRIPISGVIAITAGRSFSLALKSDGTVWGWGDDTFGELGNGESAPQFMTSEDRIVHQTPVMAQGLDDVIAIDSNDQVSLALKKDGTVWEWGRENPNRVLAIPTKIPIDNVIAIACGQNHFLALKSDGSLWSWGANDFGQMGTGPSTGGSSQQPARVLLDYSLISSEASNKPVSINGTGLIQLFVLADLIAIACGVVYFIKKKM